MFVFGNLNLRQCGDIDLLVHPEDFLKAKDLLIRNGYCHTKFGHHETANFQAQLVSEDGRTGIDLHYGITPRYIHVNQDDADTGGRLYRWNWSRLDASSTNWFFYMDTRPMWERLNYIIINDIPVPIFAAEDMLLISCINGIKENWRLLRRISDIAELIRAKPEINWDWIIKQVHTLRFERKFFLVLVDDYLSDRQGWR